MHALELTSSPNSAKLSFTEYDETHHNKSPHTSHLYLSTSSILVTYLYMPTLVKIVLYPNISLVD